MDTQGIEIMKRGDKYWVENPTNSYDDDMVKLRTAKKKFKDAIRKIKNINSEKL